MKDEQKTTDSKQEFQRAAETKLVMTPNLERGAHFTQPGDNFAMVVRDNGEVHAVFAR